MVSKAQLVDAVSQRVGDRKVATAAVEEVIDFIIRSVDSGERVTVTGFGSFEPRERAARTARNPRTGETVAVKKTVVPAFRPGTLFRDVVAGTRKLPKAAATPAAARPARRPAAPKPAAVTALTPPGPAEIAPAVASPKAKKPGKKKDAKPAKNNVKDTGKKASSKDTGKKKASGKKGKKK